MVSTFFVTLPTYGKKLLFQHDRCARLLVDCVLHYRDQGQFALHAFVIMPDHAHMVLSPMKALTIEKSVQFIKGGYSHRIRKELGYKGEIWQQSFHDRRLRDERELFASIEYTHLNPVRRGLCAQASQFLFSSAHSGWRIDPLPCG